MSTGPSITDRPCPKCGGPSILDPAETVDIGVGDIAVGPDGWICQIHGAWWVPEYGEPPLFAEDTPPYVPPGEASPEACADKND